MQNNFTFQYYQKSIKSIFLQSIYRRVNSLNSFCIFFRGFHRAARIGFSVSVPYPLFSFIFSPIPHSPLLHGMCVCVWALSLALNVSWQDDSVDCANGGPRAKVFSRACQALSVGQSISQRFSITSKSKQWTQKWGCGMQRGVREGVGSEGAAEVTHICC